MHIYKLEYKRGEALRRINLKKKCIGCGIEIQTHDTKSPGYLPEKVYIEKGDPVCKRCFRIKNYGAYIPVDIKDEDYKKEVTKTLKKMDGILFVVDIIDFEGSFDKEVLDLIRDKKIIIAVNKIDLIPDKKHPSEVANWIKERADREGLQVLDYAVLSVKQNYGVNGVVRKLRYFFKDGGNIAVIGTTNVGKSSLINGLFAGKNYVTVSKYPGTTLKTVKNTIPGTELTIHDTPGIIPNGRISDMVCQECNLKIVPSNEISRKTFKMKKDRVLMIGGLVTVKVLSDEEPKPIFSVFAAKDVTFHETNEEKAQDLLKSDSGELLAPPCGDCKDEYSMLEKKTELWEVEAGEELVFKGLGWISVKRGPLKIAVTLPTKADIVKREAFIIPKR